MKKISLNKILLAFILVLFLGFKLANLYSSNKIYNSLDNVFLEMNYAEVNSGHMKNLPDLNTVFKSPQSYRDDDIRIGMVIEESERTKEKLTLFIGIANTFMVEYQRKLPNNTYLYISHTYKNHRLTETIEASNSDTSLAWIKTSYTIYKELGNSSVWKEFKKSSYWFSSTKGLPTLQLTKTPDILDYLKPFDIDKQWLRDKSDDILNKAVLKPWFEKGSQRYSFEHLGNVEIIKQEGFEK